jgi:hypothetical protein
MTPTKGQRDIMAADLLERAAVMVRHGAESGYVDNVIECAARLRAQHPTADPSGDYANSLLLTGVSRVDAWAAVGAIADGKHPADSVPGMVTEYRRNCARLALNASEPTSFRLRCRGAEMACDWTLSRLGCAVKS